MSDLKTISVEQFCILYEVPVSFIDSLVSYELIHTVQVGDVECLPEELIAKVERLMRLHYDLNINFEGLDVVNNLIGQINELNDEIYRLKNRLDLL